MAEILKSILISALYYIINPKSSPMSRMTLKKNFTLKRKRKRKEGRKNSKEMKSGNRERKRMLLFIYIIIYGMIKYFDGCYYSAEVKCMDLNIWKISQGTSVRIQSVFKISSEFCHMVI